MAIFLSTVIPMLIVVYVDHVVLHGTYGIVKMYCKLFSSIHKCFASF